MEHVIEIKNLYKSFGNIKAVQDVSFNVEKGELFAFIGENGAGKSTTISILCGQLAKDSGEVLVCGEDISNASSNISHKLGVVFQTSVLDSALTVKDNLKNRAALYGICGNEYTNRQTELSKLLNFEDLLNRTVGKLSGGQRRRIDIARALINRPEVLVLDEPTTGLDPQTRKMLWDVISKLRASENMTVFLTTHYLEEAADADYLVILDNGRIVAEGTPLTLKNTYTGDFVTIYGITEDKIKALGKPYTTIKDGYKVQVKSTIEATEMIINNPDTFIDYEITKGKMDDVFLAVTGKNLERGEAK